MVAPSACPGRREVEVCASHWRRGRSGIAIGAHKGRASERRANAAWSLLQSHIAHRSVFLISGDHTAIWWNPQVAMVAAWSPSCVTGALRNRLFKAQVKENIKAPRHWPLCEEFTGDRWITRTKGQKRGKCFHLVTWSCRCENAWSMKAESCDQGHRVIVWIALWRADC